MTVQVDSVQMVPDGFGFHIKASEYTWITLVFETKREAEAAHSHAEKAVAQAKAVKIVKR
jgi:allantoicase